MIYAPGNPTENIIIGGVFGTDPLGGIHNIGWGAFANNMNVKSITIRTSVKFIQNNAFEYSLVQTITLDHVAPSGINNGSTGYPSGWNPFLNIVNSTLTVRVPNATGSGQLLAWQTTFGPPNYPPINIIN